METRIKNGVFKYRHEDGTVYQQTGYKNNLKDGEDTHWYGSGQLAAREFYKKDIFFGQKKYFEYIKVSDEFTTGYWSVEWETLLNKPVIKI